jgi:hypothetical protein
MRIVIYDGTPFEKLIRERERGPTGRYLTPVSVGEWTASIQASGRHRSLPPGIHPPEHTTAWEVAIRHGDATWINSLTHPEFFLGMPWEDHFPDGRYAGRYVPTTYVQLLLDLLAHPECGVLVHHAHQLFTNRRTSTLPQADG